MRKSSTLISIGISAALIAAGIWFLSSLQGIHPHGRWLLHPGMMAGGGMGVVRLLFWLILIVALVLLVCGIAASRRPSSAYQGHGADARQASIRAGSAGDYTRRRSEKPWLQLGSSIMTEENNIQTVVDPVCGMEIRPAGAEKTCYNGIELYFCGARCKSRFESSPQDYVVNKRKGYWRRYLERLNKATGGRPPSCHSV